jgi:hypothetical protein
MSQPHRPYARRIAAVCLAAVAGFVLGSALLGWLGASTSYPLAERAWAYPVGLRFAPPAGIEIEYTITRTSHPSTGVARLDSTYRWSMWSMSGHIVSEAMP